MAKIKQEIVNDILNQAKIEEVIGDVLQPYDRISNPNGLRKIGVRYTSICPFHDDHNDGNFIVYPKGNCYKCFSCEAQGDAVKFLMDYYKMTFPDAIRWLGKKYNIDVDNLPANYTPPPPRPTPPPLPILTLPFKFVTAKEGEKLNGDNLVHYIINGVHWDTAARSRINQMLDEYHIGHSQFMSRGIKHDFTIFWQIDHKNKVRTAHYMKYNRDGHRMKEKGEYNTDWFHAMLARPRYRRDEYGHAIYDERGNPLMYQPYLNFYDEDRQRVEHCLFGLHLINKYPNATVNIVESEKTALLMAIAYGNHSRQVWMACCGETNLKREMLQPLISKRCKIVLYPDRDGIDKWRQKAEDIHYDRLSINAEPVLSWWREGDGEKADIADVVTRIINTAKPMTSIEEVKQQMPEASTLINKLNLDISKQ